MPAFKRIEFSSPSLSYGKTTVQVDVLEKSPKEICRVAWNVEGKPFYSTDCAKCFEELEYSTARTSIYRKDGLELASPEHLAPVFLMWPGRSFNVNVTGGETQSSIHRAEVPMMDGSAIKFLFGLRRSAGVPEELAFYDAPVKAAWEFGYGCVRIYPCEAFEVDYILDRPDLGGFKSSESVSIYSAEDLYNVFNARTFIFERDLVKAREAGLLAGVDESCGMVLGAADGVCSNGDARTYRVHQEPARHKILDLIGDLCFIKPALPKVRIEIVNGGHAVHRQILEKVLPYAVR